MKKTYSDGSTFGPKEAGFALVAGAAIAVPVVVLKLKFEDWRMKRHMKHCTQSHD